MSAPSTVPSVGTSRAQAVFIEMFITAALVFAVLMLAAEKHRLTAFAPIGIGLTLFAGELFALEFTGGSMNTARSFGPAVVTSFQGSHWVVCALLSYTDMHRANDIFSTGWDQRWEVLSPPSSTRFSRPSTTSVSTLGRRTELQQTCVRSPRTRRRSFQSSPCLRRRL